MSIHADIDDASVNEFLQQVNQQLKSNKSANNKQEIYLEDDNGKEIYEGDILAWHSNIYRKHDWVGLVQYRGAGFAVQESDKSYSSPEWLECACRKDANIIEVIGNIHENPELLEADKWPRNHTQNANN